MMAWCMQNSKQAMDVTDGLNFVEVCLIRILKGVSEEGVSYFAIPLVFKFACITAFYHHLRCRVFGLQTPLKQTTFKGSESKQGCLVGIALDPTNHYAVTSCSDKSMTLVNFDTEECVATLGGHSSQATGMAFLNDGKHLITVSEDG